MWMAPYSAPTPSGFVTAGETWLKSPRDGVVYPARAFSVADNFEVEFSDSTMPESMKWLILGAAFAIDLDFFEKKG